MLAPGTKAFVDPQGLTLENPGAPASGAERKAGLTLGPDVRVTVVHDEGADEGPVGTHVVQVKVDNGSHAGISGEIQRRHLRVESK